MISLAELRNLVEKVFPGSPPDLVHLLCAWAMMDPGNYLDSLLMGTGVDILEFILALKRFIEKPDASDKELLRSCILKHSTSLAGHHILKALCETQDHRITRTLIVMGLNVHVLHKRITGQIRERSPLPEQYQGIVSTENAIILRYGRDLTALALEGCFSDLCDRPREIERMYQVLLRRTKANVALTGPAGTGKTALVELLARKLTCNDVPEALKGTRIFELSMGSLVAGTRYRGDFEERIEQILKAIKECSPAILFIDEMHLIWGAGSAEGVLTDASNILKPHLARGGMKVIGATTVSEYHRYIARDAALARRFQEIRLTEPDRETAWLMVRSQATGLERYHGISIDDSLVTRAVEFTDRYLPGRSQPDKGLDLLDSAAGTAAQSGKSVLSADDLALSLSAMADLPAFMVPEDGMVPVENLSHRLKECIIGQNQAMEKISAAITQRWRGFGNPERNVGTFLLAGDTGVGKTETARVLAETLYGDRKALLHVDLGEYGEYGSVNKLIGSPAGYAGCDRDGVLVSWIREQGHGVILFDEIEKAHPDVHHLILGLLDNGRIKDAFGDLMDTRQCVVVLTTNALTPQDLHTTAIGFHAERKPPDAYSLLARHFPREFLARLDEIILFRELGPEDLRRIIKLRLDETLRHLKGHDVEIAYDEKRLLDYLIVEATGLECGARGVARLIERELLQPLALSTIGKTGNSPRRFVIDEAFYKGRGFTLETPVPV